MKRTRQNKQIKPKKKYIPMQYHVYKKDQYKLQRLTDSTINTTIAYVIKTPNKQLQAFPIEHHDSSLDIINSCNINKLQVVCKELEVDWHG